ncbi:imm11 family protein [Burkholderia anthina]|uniref:imm11 family protein n=1 Tax=Burkholderia anthina TaxID=179879 RepID=UPI0033415813
MGNIYGMRQDEAFQPLVQVDDDGEIPYDKSVAIRATALCGRGFGQDYDPVKLTWGTSRRKKTSDVHTMLSPFLVFSQRALDVLAPVLRDSGEILQVDAPVKDMFGFHVTRVIENAVDMDASRFKVYPQATVFNKIFILKSRIEGADIFRLKESPATVFVSERFRELVEQNKLKGFDFGEIISQSEK